MPTAENPEQPLKDFLTGFYTRESLVPEMNRLTVDYENYKKAFSVLLLDIDYFKVFNDKYGHLLGDEVLKYFSSSIRLDLVAESVSCFRFGGDEFLILFHAEDSHGAYGLAARLLKNIKDRPCNLRGNQLKMSFSGGIASYPADGKSIDELMENADKALYASKRNGRGQVTQFSRIWLKKIKQLGIIAVILLLSALLGLAVRMNFQEKISQAAHKGMDSVIRFKQSITNVVDEVNGLFKSTMKLSQQPAIEQLLKQGGSDHPQEIPSAEPPATAAAAAVKPDVIYLKRGGVVKGHIIEQDETGVKIKLEVQSGRATVAVKMEDIEKIERQSS